MGYACAPRRATRSDAELAGWDPATSLAVLKAPALAAPADRRWRNSRRASGIIALAIARSLNNGLTASAGHQSRSSAGRCEPDAGAPSIRSFAPPRRCTTALPAARSWTRPGRSSASRPHRPSGALAVVIPSAIAWKTAQDLLEHGRMKRGYIGVAGQPVQSAATDSAAPTRRSEALLVVGVSGDGPAAKAGILVGRRDPVPRRPGRHSRPRICSICWRRPRRQDHSTLGHPAGRVRDRAFRSPSASGRRVL